MSAFVKTLFTFLLSFLAFSHAIRPKIFFDEEYIAQPQTDLIIRCEGTEPLKWTPPQNPISSNIIKYSKVSWFGDEDLSNKEYRYVSTLKITNTSYLDVGFYYCHGKNAALEDAKRSSSIYLYVEDETELTVLTDEVETVYNIAQYEESVIPCRPTAPNVVVRLYRSSSDSQIDNQEYDPRIGFKFRAESLHDQDDYTCKFDRGRNSWEFSFFLIVNPRTTSIAKPYMEDMNLGHTKVGDTLVMKCTLSTTVHFTMKWSVPHNKTIDDKRIVQDKVVSLNENKHYRMLRVHNTTKADEGNYTCYVEDHAGHKNNNSMFVRIFEIGEHFINLSEENDVYNISAKAGETVQWRIDIDAHPVDNLLVQWLDNNNEVVEWDGRLGGHYEINHTKSDAFLKINSVSINDLGNYTLIVSNDYERKDLKLTLTVKDKPSVQIESEQFHFINTVSEILCLAAGYPEPDIFWSFIPCLDKACGAEEVVPTKVYRNGLQNISSINLKAEKSGHLICYANNSLGHDKATVGFYITDVKNGFNLWHSDNMVKQRKSLVLKVSIGDEIRLYCAASIYNYTKNNIQWFRGSTPIGNDEYIIERSHTDYSYKSTLIIPNAAKNDSGEYICKIMEDSIALKEANLTFDVLEPEFPLIYETNFENDIIMDLPDSLQLICRAVGLPKPIITWYKDNVEIIFDNRTELLEDGEVLNFRKTIAVDEGQYACKSKNKLGVDSKQTNVTFSNKLSGTTTTIIISALTAILLVCMIVLIVKIRKEAKLRAELKNSGLNNFEAGQVDCLNPELGVDDQAELLPYDKKWEFPRDKIKLGKQLGSGAFGVVMKAEAQGIVEGEVSTTVAVKMVKKNADHALIKALASELKIMVHLGKHINVVNLLGACTKNVVKRELLVIVEYCRYGNIQNYLLRHRDHFIDQIDMNTGKINYTIGSEALEDRSMSFSSNRSNSQSSKSPVLKYVSIKFPKNSGEGHDNRLMADYRAGNPSLVNYSVNTDTTTVTMSPGGDSDDFVSMSNNSSGMQPEWRSNYKGDYKGNVQPICTKDLLAWAFQVARAMEYLASRKVLHGDLAARNILLADNNVVKVCDFGLAKSMYNSGNYKKKGDGPLPVKWMAVESIRDRVFSTQSDVWSFGIVLWEFFSLGRMPYPGMEADERLYHKLLDGYRMDSPNFATREIYQMMMSCWEAKPQVRPSFTLLAEQIGYMLEESVKEFYIELNDPYLVMNTNRLEDGQSDYLAMFSPPDFETLSSPQDYINENIGQDQPNGYMCMKANQIFSPREVDTDDEVFTFQVEKPLDGDSPELSPMLNSRDSNSDHESTSRHSPKTPSFTNPSYLALPDVTHVDGEILQSTQDNYVNMPKNKSAIVAGKGGTERPYVNSTTRDWEKVEA